jgi:DNA-binding GntR family transcriptional regulator
MIVRSATKPVPRPAAGKDDAACEARPQQGLSHGIAEQLQQLIYSGEIAPGQRLNEAALALRMGTSRGPIREAIRVLTGIGLVVAVPNRGVFVREISVREMAEIYELRALLFGFAAQQACERLDEASRQEGQALLDDMDQALVAGDGQSYYVQNLRFHALLLRLSGNLRAQQAYEDHAKELHLFRRRYFNVSTNMRRSNTEHRRIFEAIVAGAPDKAYKLAQAHVLQGRQRLLTTLDVPAAGSAAATPRTRNRRPTT